MRKHDSKSPEHKGASATARLALTHGQTIWLMTELGLHHGVSASTFNYYVKSLRKLGVPFEKGKGQSDGHRHVTYDFEELMELTTALLLRVYGTLPDAVIAGLRNFRSDLRLIYRQAYSDLDHQIYPTVSISAAGERKLTIHGLFLDLNIRYSAGQMIEFGPPRAISPFEALSIFAHAEGPARSYLPLNMTAVAELIIDHTRKLPPMRRSRRLDQPP